MLVWKTYALIFSLLQEGFQLPEAHPTDPSREASSQKNWELNDHSYSPNKTCFIYNGTACKDYLKGKSVMLTEGKSQAYLEQKLKKWFRYAQVTALVNRDCWPHATAVACFTHFPECKQDGREVAGRKSLCSAHCAFLNDHLCRQEYKMARYSKKLREFLPKCEQAPLVDDADGRNCMYLPTLNLNKAPEPFPEKARKVQVAVGKTAFVNCYFGIKNFAWQNRIKPKYGLDVRWYKDGQPLASDKRSSFSTQRKGKSRVLVQLKLAKVRAADAGSYRCVLTFANKTAVSTSRLHVDDSTNEINKELTPSKSGNSVDELLPNNCRPYVGELCSKYLTSESGTLLIYENARNPQHVVEMQLSRVIGVLIQSGKVSKRCQEYGTAVLCNNRFDRCSNTTGQPVHTLCKQDCLLFELEFCKAELELLDTAGGAIRLFIPDCSKLLHNNPQCISIRENPTTVQNDPTEGLSKAGKSDSPPHLMVRINKPEISESEGLVIYIIPSTVGIAILILSVTLLVIRLKHTRCSLAAPSKLQTVLEDADTLSSVATDASPEAAEALPRLDPGVSFHQNGPQRVLEAKRDCINFGSKISDIDSCELWLGEFREGRKIPAPVVVELVKPNAPVWVFARFCQQMSLLRRLNNRHVQDLLCTSIVGEEPFMAFHHDHSAVDLRQFLPGKLQDFRCHEGLSSRGLDFLIDLMHQVASGLQYLHVNNVCHKDVAAHNCLISSNCNVRLSMTPLSRRQYSKHYIEVSSFGFMPARWLPAEALVTGNFSFSTDVHMFGVLLWEMFSFGQIPHCEVPDHDLVEFISCSGGISCPADCPNTIYELIQECTSKEPQIRPTADLLLETVSDWIKLNEFNIE